MKIQVTTAFLTAIGIVAATFGSAQSQLASTTEDVQKGRHLADIICANCHVVARDQQTQPILRPPAPSFDSIAQRGTADANFLRSFLTTTHRDIRNQQGMPNPQLLDFQIDQIAAYFLSLQRQAGVPEPASGGGECSKEIARLETQLGQARANRRILGTAPESTAARLHHQPTPSSVRSAAEEAETKTETALVLARKLAADGKEGECLAALRKLSLPLDSR